MKKHCFSKNNFGYLERKHEGVKVGSNSTNAFECLRLEKSKVSSNFSCCAGWFLTCCSATLAANLASFATNSSGRFFSSKILAKEKKRGGM